MTTETRTVAAANLVTFGAEFVGLLFFGRGRTVKGRFVEARFVANGRTVEVTFEAVKPGPFGPLDTLTVPTGATLRVEARP